MSEKNTTYHIIGGGIAGLAAARFIKEKNQKFKVVVYEATQKLGGRCYSFFDAKLDRTIDNATHVILGANKNVLNLIDHPKFDGLAHFWKENKLSKAFWNFKNHILLSIFNTEAVEVSPSLIRQLAWKLFPFCRSQLKVYYSKGNLSTTLVEPLSRYIDEIKLGYIWQGFEESKKSITKLKFNQMEISIAPQDKIICAIDAANYNKIMDGQKFEFSEITNIFYRTSQALRLPGKVSFLATSELLADWVFINEDVMGVTISDSAHIKLSEDELARRIWVEIRALNGLKPAFLPPYRVLRHKQATLKQDSSNEAKRPSSSSTRFKNLRLAGDWTLKGYPCCLEAAVLSAKKAL